VDCPVWGRPQTAVLRATLRRPLVDGRPHSSDPFRDFAEVSTFHTVFMLILLSKGTDETEKLWKKYLSARALLEHAHGFYFLYLFGIARKKSRRFIFITFLTNEIGKNWIHVEKIKVNCADFHIFGL
jgi:hypothetical protein